MRVIRSWKQARAVFERWRVNLMNVQVELKLPGLSVSRPLTLLEESRWRKKGSPMDRFDGQLIYFTEDDVTVRRPSGAILAIDNYEIVALTDGKTRF